MTVAPRIHLSVLFDELELPAVAENRFRFDPAMAAGVPPHLTVIYPEEFDDVAALVDRAAVVAADFEPFSIRVGEAIVDGDDGSAGVFCAVTDPTESWSGLRTALLRPPFTPLEVPPHITIVHPRTSDEGPRAWTELSGADFGYLIVVRELSLTSTESSTGMTVRRRFPLAGGPQ